MELRQLRYFLMVAEEGHFGRAARRLNIVQPALSMQIRALEDRLGAPLFERTSRQVRLTDVGSVFLPEAKLAVAQATKAEEMVRRSLRGEVGLLRVGFFSNAAFSGRLQEDIQRFGKEHEGVRIELAEMNAVEQIAALIAGTIDLGYCTIFGEPPAGVQVHRIGRYPWRVALASGHRLADQPSISAEQFGREKLILYTGGRTESGQLLTMRALLGHDPEIAFTASTSLAVLASAASGLGIALVPETLTAIGMPNLVFVPLADELPAAELHLIARHQHGSTFVDSYLQALSLADR